MNIPNHITLEQFKKMPIGDVAALSADQLALLQTDINEAQRSAKELREWLDGALMLKYADTAIAARYTAKKDTGTARFQDGDVTVVADLPKKVVWDQAKLAELVECMKAEGDDPAEYVDISFKVPERKFAAWPNHIKAAFQEARTVRTGKESFKLILGEDGQ